MPASNINFDECEVIIMIDKIKKECGAVIVEATIVFPIMFLVIIFLLYLGNAYLQICRVEAIVNELAIEGAAYVADPLVMSVENSGVPGLSEHHVYPYRSFDPNGAENIENDLEDRAQDAIDALGSGLFSNMQPSDALADADVENYFIYSTVTVSATYKIQIPVRMLGEEEYPSVVIKSRAQIPVSDTPEFIRNVDMVEDYMQKTGVSEKIENATNDAKSKLSEALGKAKEWFDK